MTANGWEKEARMLYRFNSAASGEMVMLAPHAEEIFAAIGRPLGLRGVIAADQM
ncbi:MAG: DUF1840 family protein, partial [Brachymonas sp.]|nr:DUF1840 family protein [Brachymonas sp.]